LMNFLMRKHGINKKISTNAKSILMNYSWPGNVRELNNLIEYVSNISQTESIEIEDLPQEIKENMFEHNNYKSERITDSVLTSLFNIKDVVFILQTLLDYKEKNLSIGRKKLSNLAQLNERNLTESKIRTRLRY